MAGKYPNLALRLTYGDFPVLNRCTYSFLDMGIIVMRELLGGREFGV